MKKIGLLVGILGSALLTSCVLPFPFGPDDESTSAPTSQPTSEPTSQPTSEPTSAPTSHDVDAENRAIRKASVQTLATVSRTTDLIVGLQTDIGHDGTGFYNNDYLYLTTSQTVIDSETDEKYIVDVEWLYDKTDSFVKEEAAVDETHHTIRFNYSKTETHVFNFKGRLTCGEGTPVEQEYSVNLLDKNLEFMSLTLAQIYELNDTNNGFKLVDPKTGYYIGNNKDVEVAGKTFNYLCFETTGKVIYTSPDANWGIIADGNYYLELFSGSGLNIDAKHFPALTLGNVVTVRAELSSYYGNAQCSYIFDIENGDPNAITEPNLYENMPGSEFDGKKYFEAAHLMNACRSVNAVFKGEFKDKDGKDTTVDKLVAGKRWTFKVEVDGKELEVAYDYHVDRYDDQGVFQAFHAKLSSLNVGDTFNLKGTVRFKGDVEKTYLNIKGYWTIVPFLADHMA